MRISSVSCLSCLMLIVISGAACPVASAQDNSAKPPAEQQTKALHEAVQNARKAVEGLPDLRSRADRLLRTLLDTGDFAGVTTDASSRLSAAVDKVLEAGEGDLMSKVTDGRSAVQKQQTDLAQAIKQNADADEAEKKSADAAQGDLQKAADALASLIGTDDTPGKLQKALLGLLAYMGRYRQAIEDGLNRTDLNKDDIPNPGADIPDSLRPVLRTRLANSLGDFTRYELHASLLKSQKDRLAAVQDKVFKVPADTNKSWSDLTAAIDKLKDTFQSVASTRLKSCFEGVLKELEDSSQHTGEETAAFRAGKRTVEAVLPLVEENKGRLSDTEAIAVQWTPLRVQLRQSGDKDRQDTSDAIETIVAKIAASRTSLIAEQQTLLTVLSGDRNRFVTDQVRLFYFTDVPRLMKALNQTAEILNRDALRFREDSTRARRELIQREADLSEGQGRVSDLTTRISQIDAEVQRATAVSGRATRSFRTEDALLNRLTRQRDDYASTHPDRKPGSPEKEQYDRLDDAVKTQQNRRIDAERAQTEAEQKRQQLLDEQSGLPAQRQQAEQQLRDAQEQVRRLRRAVDLQVQDENTAFVAERDNAPIWVADAIAGSPDPLQRVILFAYEDSKVVFIRGLPEDVAFVKEIIAQYDRPAPQALITLWTLQLNGSDNKAFAARLDSIRDELGIIQDGTVGLQEALRFAVKNEVNRVAATAAQAAPNTLLKERLARYFFYTAEVRDQLGFIWPERGVWQSVYHRLTAASDIRLAASHLRQIERTDYNFKDASKPGNWTIGALLAASVRAGERAGKLLSEIGAADEARKRAQSLVGRVQQQQDNVIHRHGLMTFNNSELDAIAQEFEELARDVEGQVSQSDRGGIQKLAANLGATEFLTRYTLPDPIKSTTLGEMLFTLSLANRDSRARIYEEFVSRILDRAANHRSEVRNSPLFNFGRDILVRFLPKHSADYLKQRFGRIQHDPGLGQSLDVIFGDVRDSSAVSDDRELTANQMEILVALRTKARADLSGEVQRLLRQIDLMPPNLQYTDLANTYRDAYLYLIGWLQATSAPRTTEEGPVNWRSLGDLAVAVPDIADGADPDHDARLQDRAAWEIARIQSDLNPLSKATPRVAAADDMIKRLINAVQRDLETFFIRNALTKIYEAHTGRGVELGSIQRTSILATNRLIARVDPAASAQAETSQSDNVLQQTQQLADLAKHLQRKDRTQSAAAGLAAGGGTAFAGAGATAATGVGLLALLGAIGNQSPPPVGELYSISTGNLFRVTPIFDPSGQALRFRFDFTAVAHVREPDGTLNPQIPRVERHTVNTEVQISNMELREISGFQTNTQIGRPERKGGGLPLLNRLPVFENIPLIGYFYREAPAPAKRQESLILAQTVVYPTVSDIADLLLEVRAQPIAPGAPMKPNLVVQDSELIGAGTFSVDKTNARPGDLLALKVKLKYAAPRHLKFDVKFRPETWVEEKPPTLFVPRGETEGAALVRLGQQSGNDILTITASPEYDSGLSFERQVSVHGGNLLASKDTPATGAVVVVSGENPTFQTVNPADKNLVDFSFSRVESPRPGLEKYQFSAAPKTALSTPRQVELQLDSAFGGRKFMMDLLPDLYLDMPESASTGKAVAGKLVLAKPSEERRMYLLEVQADAKEEVAFTAGGSTTRRQARLEVAKGEREVPFTVTFTNMPSGKLIKISVRQVAPDDRRNNHATKDVRIK